MTRHLLTIAVLACLSAPALAQPDAPCLRQRDIWSFSPVTGNRALIVEDQAHRRYRVSFMGICNGLQFNMGLAFRTHGVGTLSCLARGDSVIHRDEAGPPICTIRSIEWQTPALDRADAQAKAARQR
jgi:hypothetical protein